MIRKFFPKSSKILAESKSAENSATVGDQLVFALAAADEDDENDEQKLDRISKLFRLFQYHNSKSKRYNVAADSH
jgi:hypothetical protein